MSNNKKKSSDYKVLTSHYKEISACDVEPSSDNKTSKQQSIKQLSISLFVVREGILDRLGK